ncbi:translation elongation factor EF-1 subunit alpha [Candidatus Woesearchaeota archaeon]|jgi:elongation factor 1-alpha|nr:translation elongation factor EF-1 subunit alpha [Candidatus Woesearchaeota archaeon]MBT4058541.1 translation elongation factor EF-1 subunit alpha [Candidatus Woesearchaeota archaeon]MBT4208972.1 translation elongation factor EF-1 subunit alpha [Candidatus Woesearchaeota archaeon]MBT4783486.1 translation elongation factor EF-1 subunit alpha [Candidatus Woesearchaeota archaeon]MBT5042965.1 translation elongation factor EF-1 subunit alpha [Candidatus Woesearchaeota archaeon]
MAREKPHLNVIFVGHVDHGKSTSVGRLMFDSGNVDEQAMRKLKDKAKELGKAGFEFAFVMDNLKEEQERGVTIDLSYKKYLSKNYEATIIDAPGHKDFVKNMITGSSQADVAFLVVSSNEGAMPQTKEHLWLLKTLGVNQLCVLVNKMDVVKYDEAKFNEIKENLTKLVQTAGYDPSKVNFIPASAFEGDNIYNKSENMTWYKGPTVSEQIDLFDEPEKPVDLPLRLPLQDVYNISGIGVVPVGRVETGVLKVGQKVVFVPGREGNGVAGEVKSIEMHHEQVQEAIPGDNVGFSVRGVGKKDIARGDVLGEASNPPKIASEFTARIMILNHPTVVTQGYTPVFHIHTSQVACQFIELTQQLDPATGAVIKEKPDTLKTGDAAVVQLRPTKPVVIEKFGEIPQMSKFAIRDAGSTVAAGMCIELKEKKL